MKNAFKNIFTSLLFGICLCLVLGQLGRIQINQSVAIYIHDLLILLCNGFWLSSLAKKKRKPFLPKKLRFLVLFTLWLLCTQIISILMQQSSLFGWLYLARWISFVIFLIAMGDMIHHKTIKIDLRALLYQTLVIAGIIGLFQYVFVSDTRFLYAFGWDDHLNRLMGLYFDPGFTGLLLCLGFIIALQKKHLTAQSILFVSLLLTYSRASMLTLGVTLMAYGLKFTKYLTAATWLSLLMLLVLLLPSTAGEGVKLNRTQSVTSRIHSNVSALDLYRQSPFWGIGFNNYRRFVPPAETGLPNHTSAPDNSFVFILVTSGIIGLIFFALFLWELASYSWYQYPTLCLALVAVSVHALFNNSWFYPFTLISIWILIATSLAEKSANR